MNDPWAEKWNERYRKPEYAYGIEPNNFLKEQLGKLEPGTILLPADGEGRNGVYAATLGWTVSAFDLSVEGQKKALKLAAANDVKVDHHVGELGTLPYKPGQFDAIALIYAHFPAALKSIYHTAVDGYLRTGGTIIFEAFSKAHIQYNAKNPKVGGPKDLAVLFSMDELRTDFKNYEVLELEETEIELKEGVYHNGIGSVIRFVGRKK